MCQDDAECQDNALCFLDEVHLVATGETKNDCVCKLGYHPELGRNAEDDVYPKTGYCVDLTQEDACKYPDMCIETADNWGICPYCRAFKYHDEHGGYISLGNYVSGSGSSMDDKQTFANGDSVNCGNGADRSSEAVWYCYYTAFGDDPVVALNKLDMLWVEDPLCHYTAYLYTPMACDFAL